MATAAHLRLVKPSKPVKPRVRRNRESPPPPPSPLPSTRLSPSQMKRVCNVTTLLYEQRDARLAAAAQALARLAQVIRLISSAYGVQVRWLDNEWTDERLDSGGEDDGENERETQRIAARLALAHQTPLVIGDPARGILWLARRPFDLVLHRARTETVMLEPLARGAHAADSPNSPDRPDALETSMEASAPAVRLLRVCGPAASALVVQSEALLTLAPQVANGAAQLRHLRYVLAAPHNIHRLRGELLTSWRERLLCLAVDQDDRRDERVASVPV